MDSRCRPMTLLWKWPNMRLTVVETELSAPDANGRRNAVAIDGSESLLEADVVIIAFGFSPTLPEWLRRRVWRPAAMAASSPVVRRVCRSRPITPSCLPVVMQFAVQTWW